MPEHINYYNPIGLKTEQQIELIVPPEMAGLRLDQALAELCPEYSRSRLKSWVNSGNILIDNKTLRPRDKVNGGEAVIITPIADTSLNIKAEPIALNIVYEDESMLVVNKPAGLVVHPAAGNWDGTLQNALLHHDPALEGLPRAGLVHRIDKETSGLLMVARTLTAHKLLVDQLQARAFEREYLTVVRGYMTAGGTVDAPLARHPTDRKKYAVREGGKEAITHYRVAQRFAKHTLLKVNLETGRTHQIRVHMSHINHAIVGDQVYGGRFKPLANASELLSDTLRGFKRQALHAARLGVVHPVTGEPISWECEMPADMAHLVEVLAKETPVK
ncbi:MAG: 23S rRNA pseudouridine(1911/1915/1917) synthase RluD [Cycloclasticus pugetii]|jgi:23S rRNA pseudouridine1911/1915/1917 synthase|uniref:Pseudouridine synthase n=2 Tax=Cycloclasticus TaxID=34067 RepID=S5TIF8_9GAMM|nr:MULTISPECIES: 23S rRNA pseudouridine(1911/1915/1917) synthase RluD [Cycloclasticus]AFT66340.1 Ribosomal large subunit pseudouridine synthase D [Cycloclasticus sp. P1]AGS40677.1 Ribosomal large subunit pseudouridine synthase D [Cycloclasticus zancles 78-ME]ATI04086.1 23S rRNA pseudouridine(1911/1915/1917) synthase RluD [Cycloclasticus sp. PY97N]EPD12308.1 ribosomal large subunit pseudouridine synthase D [Cycloclasticus pugetii]MBV1898403.1 23S rRNA pseudouridine(1911/1915/1917) synthase RluD|tara:strand:+ start:1242 stop:2234 length:993 start_codon:yes stop_codon:yes gene_type:complete